ncbi:unnamed protein product [Adineta steineri]|uniref:Uncharacterized protein n=1 Tax=Adineta steineri TaxID=433720 RepID=A0A814JAI7_9BILA|nr:unnamed protein product [Adineta steineri]
MLSTILFGMSNGQTTKIILKFKWDYLESLSDAKKKLLSRDDQLENYNPCHILEYGEIFATLCDLKPCTLLAH